MPLTPATSKKISAAVLCAAMAAVGCSHKKVPEAMAPGVVPGAKMNALVAADRERAGGVDSPLHKSHTYLGVDTTGEGGFYAFWHVLVAAPYRAVKFFQGDTPLATVAMMEDSKSADNRRAGILKIMQNRFARKEPYTKRYAQIAAEPAADPAVRAAAIRALNYSRSHLGAKSVIAALDDADPGVRLEAAKNLANVPEDGAVEKLIAHTQRDESKDVRIASADALRNYRTPETARVLIGVLNDRDFAVAWQARQSLRLMTGHDYRYDDNAWVQYLAAAKTPFR